MSEKYKSSIENTKTSQINYNKKESIFGKTNIDKNETKKVNKAFDNFFSSDKLKKILDDKTIKSKDNKIEKITKLLQSEFGKEFKQSIISLGSYFEDFINYIKNNQNALNIVVENGLFTIMGVCSNEDANELKELYKENHINNIEKALKNFQFPDGTKINVKNLFQSDQCKPLNLVDKLKNLKDKNGNKLTDEQIKKILKGVIFVKEINTEEKLTKEIFGKKNEDKKNTYLEYMVNMKFYFKKLTKKEEKINFIKQTLTKIGVNINKDKLEKLLNYTEKYIKLKENEDLKNVNKYLNKLNSNNKQIISLVDINNILQKNTTGDINKDITIIKRSISLGDKKLIADIASNILKSYTTDPNKIGKIATELKSGTEKEKKVGKVLYGMAGLAKELGLKITDIPPEAFNNLNNQILVNPDKAVSNFVDALLKSGKIKNKDYFNVAIKISGYFEKKGGQDIKTLDNIFNELKQLKDKNITEKDINNINKWINSLGDIGKIIFNRSIQKSHLPEDIKNKLLNGTLDRNTIEKIGKLAEKGLLVGISAKVKVATKNEKIVLGQTPEKFKHIKNATTTSGINLKYSPLINKFFTSNDIKDKSFDTFIQYLHKNNISYNEKIIKNVYDKTFKELKENEKKIAQSQKELSDNGIYTKAEQKEIYENIYYNTYLDNDFKKQFKESLEKSGIKLDEDKKTTQSNSVYAKNISETGTEKVLEQKNIFLDYQKKDGLVEIKNPFYDKNSIDAQETIKALNIKEGNTQLLLKYIQKSGFFKTNELNLGKDSMKILDQFDIDIDKELTLENIKEFSKKFISGVFFLLKDKPLSSIQKQYIKKYEKSFMQNPDDISLHEDIMTFLNDNSDLLTKIGIYDFTEEKLNLENIPSNKNEKYRDYLRKYDLG